MISLVVITVAMCSHEMFVSIANICILIGTVLLLTMTISFINMFVFGAVLPFVLISSCDSLWFAV